MSLLSALPLRPTKLRLLFISIPICWVNSITLTNEPSKVIEVAIRQWLKNESSREAEFARNLERNPPVPPRGEWND